MINIFFGVCAACTNLSHESIKLHGQLQRPRRKAVIQNGLLKIFLLGIVSSEFDTLQNRFFFAAQDVQIHKQNAAVKIIVSVHDAFTAQEESFIGIGTVCFFGDDAQNFIFEVGLPKFAYVKINYRVGVDKDNLFNFCGKNLRYQQFIKRPDDGVGFVESGNQS